MAAWNGSSKLTLASDAAGNNSWSGTLEMVAVYCKALDSAEIAANAEGSGTGNLAKVAPLQAPDHNINIHATDVHANNIDGSGITVAIVDSGIDLSALGKAPLAVYDATLGSADDDADGDADDRNGHGTFMAGIALSDATDSLGNPIGVAPGANYVDVKTLDMDGKGDYSQIIDGLNWILTNKDTYNIRVVNMSIQGPVTGPYWLNPLNQAVEALWDAGIVVVVAAGNTGPHTLAR